MTESVGIACGLLLATLHKAGLATLTHTPSPMGFLRDLCGRPDDEKPVIVIVAGHPREGRHRPRPRDHQETAGADFQLAVGFPA